MKKVLFITYMFPPIAGSGIQRPIKFVKYLPEYGIEPIVFCPQHAVWRANDPANDEYEFLKQTKIYRCGINHLKRYFELRFKQKRKNHPYFYYIALKYVWFIDFQSAWYFECYRTACQIAKKENVDCVLTTSPPHSTHLFGRYLKKKLNLPWIMDLRDALFNDATNRRTAVTALQSLVHFIYEKMFYSMADQIVTVSEPILNEMAFRHPNLSIKEKTQIITNGFDEDDFSTLKFVRQKNSPLRIVYTGSFMGKQTPIYFLEALQLLFHRQLINSSDVLIRFIGFFDEKIRILLKNYASKIPMEVYGFKPYRESIKQQKNADLLLLIVSIDEREGGAQIYTGKVFEYIGAQRPIFALVPTGPVKGIIEKGRFGKVAPPKDIEEISLQLNRIIQQWKEKGYIPYNPDMKLRNQFTRQALASQLASTILQTLL